MADRRTAQPRVLSPRFSISTTRRSVPTAAEETEYGARFSLRTPGASDQTQLQGTAFASGNKDQELQDNEIGDEQVDTEGPASGPGPSNWSNVMQQSVRMDRRSSTEHSVIAKSGLPDSGNTFSAHQSPQHEKHDLFAWLLPPSAKLTQRSPIALRPGGAAITDLLHATAGRLHLHFHLPSNPRRPGRPPHRPSAPDPAPPGDGWSDEEYIHTYKHTYIHIITSPHICNDVAPAALLAVHLRPTRPHQVTGQVVWKCTRQQYWTCFYRRP
jgi:hypothetical protein